jgi:outer membrane protein OmpA-like peptidoglycan-associated protein
MKGKRDGFFWVSYTDLMISLFFIMLAIAAISLYQVIQEKQKCQKDKEATERELEQIKQIQSLVSELEKDDRFIRNKDTGRFEIRRAIQFDQGKHIISNNDKGYLIEIGRSLEGLISKMSQTQQPFGSSKAISSQSGGSASYLIVIEGSASPEGDCASNYELSYRRAYQLWDLWLNAGLKLKIPGTSDVQISGSGSQTPERLTRPCNQPQDLTIDPSLRRFKIHVVPLIPDVSTVN